MEAKPLRIMDMDFQTRGEIPHYKSLQITRSHFETGSWSLQLDPNDTGASEIAQDCVLFPAGEPHKALLVEKIELRDGDNTLKVSGVTMDGIAKRRIVLPLLEGSSYGWDRMDGDAESVLHHYFAANVTAPEDVKRKIPQIGLAQNQHRGRVMKWQARLGELDKELADIAQFADLGWTIRADLSEPRFLFDVQPGRDLSVGNGGGQHVIFCVDHGNAASVTYLDDTAPWRTTAYAGGHGEDENRLILTVGAETTGAARREMWADCSSLSDPAELLAEGARKMQDKARKTSMQFEAQDHGALRYGVDWDLGDKVTVLDARRHRLDARITVVKETYELGKIKLDVTVGEAPVTLTGLMRRATYQQAR